MQQKTLKSSYAVQTKYEAFYTGGHTEVSHDGEHLFCMCGSKVKILEVQSGKVIHTLGKDEDDEITTFTVSPNGLILITASKNGLLQQWDWKNQMIVRTWKSLHSGPVKVMTISPTSTVLATGGSDSTVKIWDIVKQYCTHNLKGASGVFSVLKFYPDTDKNLLYGAADDCTIRVWDLNKSSKHIGEFNGHFSLVTDLAFSVDGNKLISSGRDKVVLTWNLDDYQVKSTIPAFEGIESVIVVPDNITFKVFENKPNHEYIITAGTKGVLKIWDLQTSSPVYTQTNSLVAQTEDDKTEFPRMKSATYNSNLNAICVVTHEHNILFYTLEDFTLKKQFVGYNDEVLDVCFLGENDTHIAVTTNSPMVKIFELATFSCQVVDGHTDLVLTVRSFPNEKYRFVTGAKDNTLRLWEMGAETREVSCLFVGSGHTLAVNAVACSSEFLVSGSQDTTIKVWDVPKRQYLVVATPSLNSRCTEKAHDKDINSVAISPNDKLIATASHDKTAKIWKSDNLELCGTLRGHRKGIWCVRFSPIDQIVATSSADGTMKIWSLTTFVCLKTFEGHDSSVLNVGFLSRGMQLITTASDGNMKLWTIKSNECIKTNEAHQDKTWALAVSDNEQFLVTGGADSAIILWKDVTEEEKAEVQDKEDAQILQEQKLSNYIQQKKWFKALKVAILLNQPFRALNIIKEILTQPEKDCLQETIQKMREDQILSLLKFASSWNTNSKHCSAAQAVIKAVLKLYTPEQLLKFSDIREHIEGLLPYTERHFQRLNRLQQQATFVDYLWQNMNVAGREISEFKVPSIPTYKKKSIGFFEDKMKDRNVAKELETSSEIDLTETETESEITITETEESCSELENLNLGKQKSSPSKSKSKRNRNRKQSRPREVLVA